MTKDSQIQSAITRNKISTRAQTNLHGDGLQLGVALHGGDVAHRQPDEQVHEEDGHGDHQHHHHDVSGEVQVERLHAVILQRQDEVLLPPDLSQQHAYHRDVRHHGSFESAPYLYRKNYR